MTLISFIIPTLNCANSLSKCLQSIKKQTLTDYKILIIDGGSTDNTLKVAQDYNCQILSNPLKTAEAGKAIGIKKVTSKFTVLIDSDNILPTSKWLSKMLLPFKDETIIGSEPIAFTYRKNAGYIERYSALIGANDPFAYISGISDRINYIDYHWTHLCLNQQSFPSYIKIKLSSPSNLPTIGANGTIFRTDFLKKYFSGKYFFDIDLISSVLNKTQQPLFFAKVKSSIIHTYCESSIKKFIRKQNRRLRDYFTHQSQRSFDYSTNSGFKIIHFSLYSLLIIPSLIDSIRGYLHKPDVAWFFHPLACLITFWIYFYITILRVFGFNITFNRNQWHQ